jgi:lysozyme
MPSSAQKPPTNRGLLATACAIAIAAITASAEGLITHPNPDPGNPKLMEVCYGDTEVPMRIYTVAECKALLNTRQIRDYAPKVLACVPAFKDERRIYAFAASVDAAYNIGTAAFCKSPMAEHFRKGDWAGGCNAFRGYFVTAKGKLLRGLVRRREAEAVLCAKSA